MLEWFGKEKKSFFDRWIDRLGDRAEQAADSLERTSERAVETAERLRRKASSRLRDAGGEAAARARSSRDRISQRAEAIAERAEELRRRYSRRRQEKRIRRRERSRVAEPLEIDIGDADRITLRGRRPVDIRAPDGEVIRYRYYDTPGLAKRIYLRARGRRVWPPS